jgi:hypothetical protein
MTPSVMDDSLGTRQVVTGPTPGSARSVTLAVALAAAILLGIALAARLAASRDPLRRAWSAAGIAGTYAFEGTTRATTEAGSAEYAVAGTGETDGTLLIAVRPAASEGAGVSVTVRIAWPVVEEPGELDPHALALLLPAGDPLALLATGHGAVGGALEDVGGRACRLVRFHIGAEAYGAWWRAHPHVLPVNADSGGLDKLTGEGTLWQEPDSGLPCRIAARLDLPRLGGDQPGVGEVDWVYREWGERAERTQPPPPERSW